ncbi:hypothetical protein Nmel_013085 [Mimus melanotis]
MGWRLPLPPPHHETKLNPGIPARGSEEETAKDGHGRSTKAETRF